MHHPDGLSHRAPANKSTVYWMQRPATRRSFRGFAARFPCHKFSGNLSSSSMNWGEGHRHVMASESLGRSLIDSSPRVSPRTITLLRQNSCLCGHDLLVYVSMKFFISAPPHFSSLRCPSTLRSAPGALCLFATHFHELTTIEQEKGGKGVQNLHVTADADPATNRLTMLYKVLST